MDTSKKTDSNSFNFKYTRSVSPTTNASLTITNNIKNHFLNDNYQPSLELLNKLDDGYGMGDKLCDAWLADAKALPAHGMPIFKQALEGGSLTKAPKSLQNLFNQALDTPTWVDDKLVNVASDTLLRYPLQLGLSLQSISLMGGYSVPGLAAPLLATNSLSKSVVPRMARTLGFVAAATIPNGLKEGAIGFKQTLHTRVVHGLVRQHLQHSDTWDTARFGVPISQTDMVATNMVFSLAVIHGFLSLKCKVSHEERLAILHLWRYVGHILGIEDELMPKTETECNKWLYSYLITQEIDAKSARPLAESLHELPLQIENNRFKGLAKLEKAIRAGVTRMYWGDDICDDLGLPKSRLAKSGVIALANAQNLAETIAPHAPIVEQTLISGAEKYRNTVKDKYLIARPELAPLFAEIEESFEKAS